MPISIDPWKLFRIVLVLATLAVFVPGKPIAHQMSKYGGEGSDPRGCSMMHQE